ncbi:anthranilate phosphoribosyltransferase [Tuberibacillus calidus]|uniref:anthranilate phosphoribosyltransferase n=1 Tax=Tuberibacillus calidus TaxID=340097 RepID=UPI000426F2CE|nr:anthranilate phosphoribosyltransferase [Tuberibacillus calidus]
MSQLFQDGLKRLIDGETLSRDASRAMMDDIMRGEATPNQISSFLTVLRFRGETAEELTGFAESLRQHCDRLIVENRDVLDTCGTGGDGSSTFNISTAVALLTSGMGVNVAKHGNRAVSSKSGSADVIEALGLTIPYDKEAALAQLEAYGMCFLYAPIYHASMKHATLPRKELGFRTIFNLLGPLVNPAGSRFQLLGVYSERAAEKMAHVLNQLGTKKALLVTGHDGMDEASITGPTTIFEVACGTVQKYTIEPEDVGLPRGRLKDLQVKNARESAALIEATFSGKANSSAENIVCLNTGCALYTVGKAKDLQSGVEMAKEALASGVGLRQLQRMRVQRNEGLADA